LEGSSLTNAPRYFSKSLTQKFLSKKHLIFHMALQTKKSRYFCSFCWQEISIILSKSHLKVLVCNGWVSSNTQADFTPRKLRTNYCCFIVPSVVDNFY